eukprot:TRINITY_DN8557_c0_g1_i3.p1 TRINITY_DN8557_c0_g1~~TRINITY_DN8557_c0_g1_i3.p1  ORF type:complete len:289 (-),score=51.36 TRINITY_DN8557_c0_g1_i3:185-1051(-)
MEHHAAYPLHLALAYLFAIGYGLRTLFVSFRLPGAVGVILSGYVLSHFMQDDVLLARDHLQQLSFFLVLLTAGFEISINDLKPYMLIPGILPSLLECVGLATYAVWILEYSLVEAGVLASCLMALGALGSVPATAKFFARNPNRQQVQAMILTSARLYIVVLSVLGSIALDILGRQVLNRLHNLPGCEQQRKEETEIVDLGLREQDRNLAAILNAELPELMLKGRNIETSEDERLAMDTLLAGKLLEEAAAQQQLDPSQTDMLQPSLRRASSRRMTTSLQQPTLFYSI